MCLPLTGSDLLPDRVTHKARIAGLVAYRAPARLTPCLPLCELHPRQRDVLLQTDRIEYLPRGAAADAAAPRTCSMPGSRRGPRVLRRSAKRSQFGICVIGGKIEAEAAFEEGHDCRVSEPRSESSAY